MTPDSLIAFRESNARTQPAVSHGFIDTLNALALNLKTVHSIRTFKCPASIVLFILFYCHYFLSFYDLAIKFIFIVT